MDGLQSSTVVLGSTSLACGKVIIRQLCLGLQGASLDHANGLGNGSMDDFDFSKEAAVERRCSDAFAAVQHFEKTHCLALQHMALPFLQRRPQLVATCLTQAAQLGLKDEVSHDAVLLMDRTMSTGLEVWAGHETLCPEGHACMITKYACMPLCMHCDHAGTMATCCC